MKRGIIYTGRGKEIRASRMMPSRSMVRSNVGGVCPYSNGCRKRGQLPARGSFAGISNPAEVDTTSCPQVACMCSCIFRVFIELDARNITINVRSEFYPQFKLTTPKANPCIRAYDRSWAPKGHLFASIYHVYRKILGTISK